MNWDKFWAGLFEIITVLGILTFMGYVFYLFCHL